MGKLRTCRLSELELRSSSEVVPCLYRLRNLHSATGTTPLASPQTKRLRSSEESRLLTSATQATPLDSSEQKSLSSALRISRVSHSSLFRHVYANSGEGSRPQSPEHSLRQSRGNLTHSRSRRILSCGCSHRVRPPRLPPTLFTCRAYLQPRPASHS